MVGAENRGSFGQAFGLFWFGEHRLGRDMITRSRDHVRQSELRGCLPEIQAEI